MFRNKISPNQDKEYKIRVSWFDKITSKYSYGDWRSKLQEKFLKNGLINKIKYTLIKIIELSIIK